jgi:hypothetical protein
VPGPDAIFSERTVRTTRSHLPLCALLGVAISATAGLHAQAAPPAAPQAEAADATTAPAPATAPEAAPAATPQAPDATPAPETMVATIKTHAQQCSDAQLRMDFDKILPYVPKKLLELMGGRDALKTKLAQGNAELKRRGVTIDSAAIGTPAAPQRHAGLLASLVPMTTNLTTPQGKLVATSHLIAISEDNGASWVFVDTATVNDEKLGTLYPPLKGKLQIPPATARVVE